MVHLRWGLIAALFAWGGAAGAAEQGTSQVLCDYSGLGIPDWSENSSEPGLATIAGGLYRKSLTDDVINEVASARADEILSSRRQTKGGDARRKLTNAPSDYERAELIMDIKSILETRRDRSFCFFAVRLDARQFDLDIHNLVHEITPNRPTAPTRSLKSVVYDYNLDALDGALRFTRGTPVALVNAGWSIGVTDIRPVGLTRVDGQTLIDTPYVSGGLSAILCVSRREEASVQPLSLFYFDEDPPYNWTDERRETLRACDDFVQVGPRIIEWHNAQAGNQPDCVGRLTERYAPLGHKIGVCDTTLFATPRRRAVLVANYGGIDGTVHDAEDPTIYLIVTRDEVVHYDIQDLILTSGLFGPPENLWAINLAGDKLTSMIFQPPEGPALKRDERVSLFTAISVFRAN